MNAKQSTWNDMIKPVVVLLVICLVAGLALAVVNSVTAPIIAEHTEAEKQATYRALLPEADSFTDLATTVDGVSAAMKANNGAGYIVAASAKGYKSSVTATVAFDNDGNILSLAMDASNETTGIGTRVAGGEFVDQFSGKAAEQFDISGVDTVTGATYSSRGAVNAINLAVQAYQEVRGN